MKNHRTRLQIFSALFAGLISVISIISIPTPSGMPITLQTFIVALSGFVLGSKYGTVSVIIYLALGSMGLPIFSGMMGGAGKLIGVTGGFLTGFLFISVGCGISTNKKSHKLLFATLGLAMCHILGSLWFAHVSDLSPLSAFVTASLPYLPKDIVSVLGAYFLWQIIKSRVNIEKK